MVQRMFTMANTFQATSLAKWHYMVLVEFTPLDYIPR